MDNQKPQGSPFSNLSGGFSFDEQASFSFPDITFPTINAGFGPAGHPLNPVQPSPVVQQPATPIAKSHANATTKFKVGQIVKLTGLISSPELNGKVGEIVGLPDPKTSPDRYGVELFNTKQRIKAKPINLLDIFWDYRDSDSEDLSSEDEATSNLQGMMQRAFSFDMPEESKKQKKFAQLQSLRKPEHQFSLILYCRILHIKPIIWRKFQVPSTTSLELFHKVLLCSFGWASPGYHGYIFREFPRHPRVNGMDTYGLCYGPRDTHGLDDMVHGQRLGLFYINSDEVFVSDFLKQKGHKLLYEYDLGDSWEHKITVEDVIPYDPQIKLFDGKCACPPEDFGGRHEYSKALYSFKHHEGTKYRDYVHSANHAYNYRHAHETGKSHFDPNVVDLEACRRQLLVLVDPKEAKRLAKQQYRATGKTISCSCALCVRDKEPPRIPPSSPFAGITMLNQRGGEYDPTDRQASNLQRDQVEYIGDKDGIHCCAYCLDRECPNNPQMKFKACGQCVMKYYCSVTCQKLDWRWRHKVWCTKYVVQPTLQPELMKSLRDGAEKKKTK